MDVLLFSSQQLVVKNSYFVHHNLIIKKNNVLDAQKDSLFMNKKKFKQHKKRKITITKNTKTSLRSNHQK